MKMTDEKRHRSRGIGSGSSLPTILFIVFLILKLTDVIDWKWLWVFSPIWISVSLGVLFLIVIGFILLAALVGIVGASSGLIVGIKSWFSRTDQEDNIEE